MTHVGRQGRKRSALGNIINATQKKKREGEETFSHLQASGKWILIFDCVM